MQIVSRDVIRLLSQFRVIFQIKALERSDNLDWSRSLRCLPLVVLRHVTAQGVPRPASLAPLVDSVMAASRATNE
jgi:hypothetical protein